MTLRTKGRPWNTAKALPQPTKCKPQASAGKCLSGCPGSSGTQGGWPRLGQQDVSSSTPGNSVLSWALAHLQPGHPPISWGGAMGTAKVYFWNSPSSVFLWVTSTFLQEISYSFNRAFHWPGRHSASLTPRLDHEYFSNVHSKLANTGGSSLGDSTL